MSPSITDHVRLVEEALDELRAGRMVIVVDDENRENEGDLVMLSEHVTPAAVNFMVTHARGLVCLCLSAERCDELELPMMSARNTAPRSTAFTVSIEAREGTTTGISAADRALTIQVASDPSKGADDLVRPGHVFPLRAMPGGVLRRAGHTEAAVDLARLAGSVHAGVVCEIMNEDGSMARRPDLELFAERHGLKVLAVADLIKYRMVRDELVRRVAQPSLPTAEGDWQVICYDSLVDEKNHLAFVHGQVDDGQPVLVRVHSECLTGDVFGSVRCDCGDQLEAAKRAIIEAGAGVIVYLRQEGRGIGLVEKLKAYELQDAEGLDTVEANVQLGHLPDKRDYGTGAQILRDLGVRRIRYMTNNPHKFVAIEAHELEIVERVPLEVTPHERSRSYLETKRDKMGHLLTGL
ncbi:MAG: bifunctional 3,4-dihydroxy-2-butanone-4-phosphate synthase/GTP cyclohydrolase II [Acidobacteriota bacterium]